MAPRGPQRRPRRPPMGPKGPQEGPQIAPKSVFQGLPTSKPKKGMPRPISNAPRRPSDLYFTRVFEHCMFRFFIVSRSLISPHGAQHGPQEGPQNGPNRRFRLAGGLPFSASMLEGLGRPIWERFGGPLGALWGPSWRLWGQLDPNMTPTWPSLGLPEGPSDLCFTMVF